GCAECVQPHIQLTSVDVADKNATPPSLPSAGKNPTITQTCAGSVSTGSPTNRFYVLPHSSHIWHSPARPGCRVALKSETPESSTHPSTPSRPSRYHVASTIPPSHANLW